MVEIIGYADRLTAKPGEALDVMVSTTAASFRAALVRLLGAPAVDNEYALPLETIAELGDYPGREQPLRAGSCAVMPLPDGAFAAGDVRLTCWFYPTLPQAGHPQVIFSLDEHLSVWLNDDGQLQAYAGDAVCRTAHPVKRHTWYALTVNWAAGSLDVSVHQVARLDSAPHIEDIHATPTRTLPATVRYLVLAATPQREHVFNGKIEQPRLYAGQTLVGAWDFNQQIHTSTVIDTSSNVCHGTLYNTPMRGCTGHRWNGTAHKPTDNPDHYGAIHFHDDDLTDAEWDVDVRVALPDDLTSGAYAVRLETAAATDYIPFFVPPAQASPHEVLFLAPTHTYVAYANERLAGLGLEPQMGHPLVLNDYDRYLLSHPALGKSIYDVHNDGSGVAYSSYLRPVINLRPNYRTWLNAGPRHLAADLYILGWLEQAGCGYDVATDADLEALLPDYRVLVTGTHPEYWTRPMMDSLQAWLADGGRLMYLGGNGFYWVTGVSEAAPHVVEVRRGVAGTRSWDSAPGELYLSTTGDLGGLWRHAGYVPQAIVGVGFTAEGWGTACGYQRRAASYDGAGAIYFDGIEADVIGEFGYVMGGAVGDEVDRLDFDLGTPASAHWLASSTGLDNTYQLVHEDLLFTQVGTGGAENGKVRADIVVFETGNNGKVFSVGSINYGAALAWNGYDNNIARLTHNVLVDFLS